MSDETTTTQAVEITDQVSTTQHNTEQPTTPEADVADSVEKLPKWAQKLVDDLRKENAKHRTEKTKAEKAKEEADRLAAEKSGEFEKLYQIEKDARALAEKEAKETKLSLLKTNMGNKYKLPTEFHDRLRGSTEEEIEADARALKAALPTPALNTDGGSGANPTTPTPGLSVEEIKEFAAIYNLDFEIAKQQLLRS